MYTKRHLDLKQQALDAISMILAANQSLDESAERFGEGSDTALADAAECLDAAVYGLCELAAEVRRMED